MTLTLVLKKGFYPNQMCVYVCVCVCVKYESSITYHSKAMANIKVFADKQTDKWTDQKLYAPNQSIRTHKNQPFHSLPNCKKKPNI